MGAAPPHPRPRPRPRSHLVHVDVVVVGGVVDGLEEPLELAGGPTVHHQHEGDPNSGGRLCSVCGVLVPLDIHICLPWTQKTNI